MISRDCNFEHLANSFSMARVHISSFKEVIVLVVARCLWQGDILVWFITLSSEDCKFVPVHHPRMCNFF